jgi:hypothetical protein
MACRWPELGIQRVERVTGIEPALSAWESVPSGHLHGLTCEATCPLVTVKDLPSLRLMAR